MRRTALVVLSFLVLAGITFTILRSGPHIDDNSVLTLDIGGQFAEAPPTDALARLMASGPALPTLLLQLEKAAADERIRGVLLHIRPLQLGYARTQELRDAVVRLRESGKPVVALLDIAALNATRELFLASAASKVYAVPGYLGPLAGVSGEFLHLGGILEKLGVRMEYERIGIYKSAPEMFAARGMSDPARANANELFDGIYEQLVAGVAEGRGLSTERVRELVTEAPGTARELVEAGLVDGIANRTEALERAGLGRAETVGLEQYLHVDPTDLGLRDGPAIALIFGDGTIVSQGGGPGTGAGFTADRIIAALDDAGEDDEIAAVVFRVNSGGGSPLASDAIWQAVRKLRELKPVVISMADAAASGGYYVASGANAILAEPATLTGSIGVFLLRPSISGLYEKLEINATAITRGPFAPVSGGSEPLTPLQRERVRQFVRSLYDDFLERVSVGRELPTPDVDKLGQGHVWLGSAALENGLIDELGGLWAAVHRAKEAAGIDPDVDPRRVLVPGPRSLSTQFRDLMQGQLRTWLIRELLPVRVPAVFGALAYAVDAGVAYVPGWWIEFY